MPDPINLEIRPRIIDLGLGGNAVPAAGENEGLTSAQVDARIAALVSAWARDNTSPVPLDQIPAGITRDTEMMAAIMAALGTLSDPLTQSDVDDRIAVISASLGLAWPLEWDSSVAYPVGRVVRADDPLGLPAVWRVRIGPTTAGQSPAHPGGELIWDCVGYLLEPDDVQALARAEMDFLPVQWAPGDFKSGDQRGWEGTIYRRKTDGTDTAGQIPSINTDHWDPLGTGTPRTSGEDNVQSDWDESDTGSDAFILNKPTIPTVPARAGAFTQALENKLAGVEPGAEENEQADFSQTDSSADDFIKNKPPDVRYLPPANALPNGYQPVVEDGAWAYERLPTMRWRDAWNSANAYAANDITHRNRVLYRSRTALAENAPATSYPGTGSAWEAQWERLAYFDGPPNAYIGLALVGETLTATREGGTNPTEIVLPAGGMGGGGGLSRIGSLWNATAASNGNFQDTGIALPDDPADDALFPFVAQWAGYPRVFGALLGSQIKALPMRPVGFPSSSGVLIAAEAQGATSLFAGQISNGNLVVGNDEGEWQASNYFALYETAGAGAVEPPSAGDSSSGYLFYTRPPLSAPADVSADQAITNAGVEYTILDNETISGAVFADTDFTTQWFGYLTIRGTWAGSGANAISNLEVDLETTHIFNGKEIVHTRAVRISWPKGVSTLFSLNNLDSISTVSVGSYRPPGGNSDGSDDIEITTADLAGPVQITYKLKFRGVDRRGAFDPFTLQALEWHDMQTRSFQIGGVSAMSTPTPSISNFSLTGETMPPVGSIAGKMYAYDLAVSQSSHATAVRIVGFKGTEASPTSVAVLATLASDQFAHHSGTVTLPPGVTLAANEVYSVRAEAYGEGQTAASDDPASYQDQRIVPHTATTATRFFRIPDDVGTPPARPDASSLLANMTVMESQGSPIGDWTVSGIPDDGDYWLVGLIVPANAVQPQHFTLGGINNDIAWADPFDLTENGVTFHVYMNIDEASGDESYNGAVFVVT